MTTTGLPRDGIRYCAVHRMPLTQWADGWWRCLLLVCVEAGDVDAAVVAELGGAQ